MTQRKQTRKRGEAKKKVTLFATVDRACKAKVDKVAEAIGISQAAAVELLLSSIDVDANGRPAFYDGPLAKDAHEELPLNKIA